MSNVLESKKVSKTTFFIVIEFLNNLNLERFNLNKEKNYNCWCH